MRLVWGSVLEVVSVEPDLRRLSVLVDTESSPSQAVAYVALTGPAQRGDRVLLNTTAVDLELGTGGIHFVVARADADVVPSGVALADDAGGHIMKLRYTPLQRDVLAAEEPASPHHEVMATASTLDGMPVVCCGLHSQLPLVAAAVKRRLPDASVAYVMDDAASLPIALSELVRACRRSGLVDATLTSGQAFGGEIEAVTLHSALLAARHVSRADVAIVAIGPGVVGTGSVFGHGGVAQAEAMNAAACLGGIPVAVLRLSFSDARPRHRGVSHHSLTALGRVALAPALVPVPPLSAAEASLIEDALAEADVWRKHVRVEGEGSLPDLRGVKVRSMGRGPDDDPAFFAAAVAAGDVAARVVRGEIAGPAAARGPSL